MTTVLENVFDPENKSFIKYNNDFEALIQISDLAKDYAKCSRSKNTVKSYESDLRDFEVWCRSKGLKAIPADPCSVACYLAERASKPFIDPKGQKQLPLKTSTLARRLSAISQAHQVAGIHFNRRHPAIQETWKGIKNIHGTAQKGKEPILIDDLRRMIESIQTSNEQKNSLIGFRDKALLLLGFAGAFRRSELVSLQVDDLKLVRDGYIVKIRRSKTDQQGEGREIAIPYGSNPITCPVRALQDWISIGNLQHGPLFMPINRHDQKSTHAMTSHAVAIIIKKYIPNKEMATEFSGHSLRAGFATTAAMAGVQEYAIMKQTGHKRSDTLKKYIRARDLWRENAASKLGL
ncbi:site-specific tyrosine recombinase XerD [Candidatus Rubidus massiliensis]|nr:site-specific tyrosine recombinase XerD [Candidatus Rubidus massiliensis]